MNIFPEFSQINYTDIFIFSYSDFPKSLFAPIVSKKYFLVLSSYNYILRYDIHLCILL